MSHPRTSLNNACQTLFGKNSSKMPQIVYDSRGPSHNPIWTATVYIEGIVYGSGEGRTQSAAGDAAATQALSELLEQYGNN